MVHGLHATTSLRQEVRMTRRIVLGLFAIGIGAAVAAAPGEARKKGKKAAEHSMTGCLQKGDTATTYKLTNVEGTGPKMVEIVGASAGVNLAAHVGHKVEITGR